MSKNNGSNGRAATGQPSHVRRKPYTTTTGISLMLQAIPSMLLDSIAPNMREEWTEKGIALPVCPQYEAKLAGGGVEYHDHDETTLTNDEERAAWAAYKAAESKWATQLNERTMNAILAKGVILSADMTDNAPWIQEQLELGFKIPKSPLARRLYYIKNEAVGNPIDLYEIMRGVMQLTGVPAERMAAAEESFRSQLEEFRESENEGDSPVEIVESGVDLESQPAIL